MAKITLVPTPIGNLEDISLRALKVLSSADLIAAEDTRTTGNLLKHYELDTPLTALHQHNEHKRVPALITDVKEKDIHLAVVSDAGTPGISDPGFLLVKAAWEENIPVEALPGATAFVPALVASGLPASSFLFLGFLPVKKGRQTRIKEIADTSHTTILYESPHRIQKLLRQLLEFCNPERMVVVARELSKLHETYYRGSLSTLCEQFEAMDTIKGEIVVIIEGKG